MSAKIMSLSETPRLSTAERQTVRDALNDMLQSPPFRTTRQCQELLRYIVLHSLDGEDDLLRERVIGVEVFGRRPDYDQASDPVVRIRAAEVRKRIALYYEQPGAKLSPIRLSVPSGSYRANFEMLECNPHAPATLLSGHDDHGLLHPPTSVGPSSAFAPQPESLPAPSAAPRAGSALNLRYYAAAAAAVLIFAAVAWVHSVRNSPLRRFWAPVLHDPHRALVYAGGNTMYGFAPQFMANYLRQHPVDNEKALNRTLIVHLDPDQTLKGNDVVQLANTFVSVGDSATIARIAAFFAVEQKAYETRFDQDISVGDMRQQPTVLIGAYNNDWTMELTDNMRFVFVPGLRIQDRTNPSRWWQPKPNLSDDFALVSRVLDTKTGQVLVTAAGLGQAGTSAAGEFLTDKDAMKAFIGSAPPDWEKKNLQIVLHTNVINGSPSAPKIIATAYW